jgi:hypothetical protein
MLVFPSDIYTADNSRWLVQHNRFQAVMDKRLRDIDNWQNICNNECKKDGKGEGSKG